MDLSQRPQGAKSPFRQCKSINSFITVEKCRAEFTRPRLSHPSSIALKRHHLTLCSASDPPQQVSSGALFGLSKWSSLHLKQNGPCHRLVEMNPTSALLISPPDGSGPRRRTGIRWKAFRQLSRKQTRMGDPTLPHVVNGLKRMPLCPVQLPRVFQQATIRCETQEWGD